MTDNKIISIVIEPDKLDEIKRLQLERGILSRSEMIRILVNEGLRKQKEVG